MNCDEIQSLLHGYVDGALDVSAAMAVECHLEDCWSCSQIHDNLLRLKATLRDRALYAAAPLHLVRSLETQFVSSGRMTPSAPADDRVSHDPPLPREMVRRWRRLNGEFGSWSGRRWGIVVAAVACLVLLNWSLRQRTPSSAQEDRVAHEVVASHVRSLLAHHLTDLTSSDPHQVQGWFNGKLSYSPAVVQTPPRDIKLVGARLDYIDNRLVAGLVYKWQQHVVNVLVCPTVRAAAGADDGNEHSGSTGDDASLDVRAERGYHLCYGTLGGLTYWVVSDLDAATTRTVAREVIPTVSTKCA